MQPDPLAKKIRKELQCPVCDQIPSSLPIPCCSSGHILCKECKQKIVYNREIGDKPCPVCRSPLGRTTSYLACTLISSFSDIPCSNKISGCSFEGTLDEVKSHLCLLEIVSCFVCGEDCMRKDFFLHNSKNCFIIKDAGKTIDFPTEDCFYMIQDSLTEKEVLVQVFYVKNQEDDELDNLLITSFGVEPSNPSSTNMPSKMKIVMMKPDKPSFNLEVITEIENYYIYNPSASWDIALTLGKEKSSLQFEMIQ